MKHTDKELEGYWRTKKVYNYLDISRSTFYANHKDVLQAHPTSRFVGKNFDKPRYWPETVKELCMAKKPPKKNSENKTPKFQPPKNTQQMTKTPQTIDQPNLPGFNN